MHLRGFDFHHHEFEHDFFWWPVLFREGLDAVCYDHLYCLFLRYAVDLFPVGCFFCEECRVGWCAPESGSEEFEELLLREGCCEFHCLCVSFFADVGKDSVFQKIVLYLLGYEYRYSFT